MASDRVAAAVAELYGADPDAFTERRKALAAAAREAGDKQAAAAIGGAAQADAGGLAGQSAGPGRPGRARPAGRAWRPSCGTAERAKDGLRLRELSAARGSLLDALTAQALAAAGTPDPPPSLRAEVTDTLTAALADPETAAAFAAGALTKAAQWSGFGYGDLRDGRRLGCPTGPASPSTPTPRRSTSPPAGTRRARTAADSGSDSGDAPPASTDERSAPSQPNAASRPIRLPRQAARRSAIERRELVC